MKTNRKIQPMTQWVHIDSKGGAKTKRKKCKNTNVKISEVGTLAKSTKENLPRSSRSRQNIKHKKSNVGKQCI